MDANSIQQIITTLGFPIVCVIAMGFFIKTLWNQSQEQNVKREEKLYTFISKAQEQNEKLSQTNSEFVTVLTSYKNDLDTIKEDISVIKVKVEN